MPVIPERKCLDNALEYEKEQRKAGELGGRSWIAKYKKGHGQRYG